MENFLWALAYVWPAYVTNATPVVAVKILKRRHPIDMHATFIDGRRLLGDGKTIEGFVSGLAFGTLIGLAMMLLIPGLFRWPLEILLITLGAMMGDIAGTFIKRRLGIPHGGPAPILDQLGFLAGSLALIAATIGLPKWLDMVTIAQLAVFTLIMHIATNVFAYLLKIKDRWW
ncbi:MAG: CDP-2,3-bis-(O-geranylgeranyl)-sn-glycerol synthase [Aigarchaeota archaeon]|nr:CDP-2,3-bis-(O-geranylgeranyl)-sn-glycerol synthase [Candidatus Pelearchaeum maunauluense]